MTTSQSWNFNLDTGSLILEAFDQIGVRPVEVTREYLSSAIRSLNLELQSLANAPVNLWEVQLVTFPLVAGQSVYQFDNTVQLVVDAFVSNTQNSGQPIDRILTSISRDEWSAYPVKNIEGASTVYWFERLNPPVIQLWPVPDATSEQLLSCYTMKRVQDANLANGQVVDLPIRFLDAICSRLATRLSVKYNEKKYPLMKQISDAAMSAAMVEDQERVQLRLICDFGSYQV